MHQVIVVKNGDNIVLYWKNAMDVQHTKEPCALSKDGYRVDP